MGRITFLQVLCLYNNYHFQSNTFFNITIVHFIFIGCIKNKFKSYIVNDSEYQNCSTPWQTHLLGLKNYSEFTNPCNREQTQKLVNKDIKFMKNAATFNITGCQSKLTTNS